jgi:hypothetical protein
LYFTHLLDITSIYVIDAVIFEVVFFSGVIYTGSLLRPTQNSKLYAEFSQVPGDENVDIELHENIDDELVHDDDLDHIAEKSKPSLSSSFKVVETVA